MLVGEKSRTQLALVKLFAIVPLLALIAAVPFAWGGDLAGFDITITAFFYPLTCLDVTVVFHRYFTHGSFKANRGLRIALAMAVRHQAGRTREGVLARPHGLAVRT